IHQTARKIREIADETPAIEMGNHRHRDHDSCSRYVITTNLSMYSDKRLARYPACDFSLVIIDEAHRSVAKSYKKVICHFTANPNLKLLLATATPDRADERKLGEVCKTVAFNYEILDAINDGWLTPVEQYYVTIEGLDFSGLRVRHG